jgi:hypothetical protein
MADSFVSFPESGTVIGALHNSLNTSIVAISNDSGSTWSEAYSGGLGPGLSFLTSFNTRTTLGNAVLVNTTADTAATAAIGTEFAIYNITTTAAHTNTLQRTVVPTNLQWNFPTSPISEHVCLFSSYSGKVININITTTLNNNITWLKTVVIKRNCTAPPKESGLGWGTLGYADIWLFESNDQRYWKVRSVVATHEQTAALGYQEGANENDIVRLGDGTLLVVFRADGGDGYPDHKRKPFLKVISTDNGMTWTQPVSMGKGVGSARPMLLLLDSGMLLLSGGRPYLNLWASSSGTGKEWTSYNLAKEHNMQITAHNASTWKFCTAFANSTATWQGSTCYTSLIKMQDGGALICYDNLGTASPVAPVSCQTNPVLVFCMQVQQL